MSLPPAVEEGSNARFRCTVSGSPRPTVTWLQGNKPVAECEGKQHGSCTTIDEKKYKANWVDERTCTSQLSSSPTNGRWLSWLNVMDTRFPADAVDYTCVVNNSLGVPKEQHGKLNITGKSSYNCSSVFTSRGQKDWWELGPTWPSQNIGQTIFQEIRENVLNITKI